MKNIFIILISLFILTNQKSLPLVHNHKHIKLDEQKAKIEPEEHPAYNNKNSTIKEGSICLQHCLQKFDNQIEKFQLNYQQTYHLKYKLSQQINQFQQFQKDNLHYFEDPKIPNGYKYSKIRQYVLDNFLSENSGGNENLIQNNFNNKNNQNNNSNNNKYKHKQIQNVHNNNKVNVSIQNNFEVNIEELKHDMRKFEGELIGNVWLCFLDRYAYEMWDPKQMIMVVVSTVVCLLLLLVFLQYIKHQRIEEKQQMIKIRRRGSSISAIPQMTPKQLSSVNNSMGVVGFNLDGEDTESKNKSQFESRTSIVIQN